MGPAASPNPLSLFPLPSYIDSPVHELHVKSFSPISVPFPFPSNGTGDQDSAIDSSLLLSLWANNIPIYSSSPG